ncbi:MAG: Flp pilus assembly protein CpaB [Nocardioidaceae bacterium]
MSRPVAPSLPALLARLARRARRSVLAHRRPLAALCAALAVGATVRAQAAPPPAEVVVLVAAHDLGGGVPVRPSDLTTRRFAPGSVPAGVLAGPAAAVGRTTVAPVRAGEPLTDVRLLSHGLLAGYPGSVAAPVRIGDPASVALVRVGDRVDVLAADPQGDGEAEVVAADAPVIALPRRSADAGTDLVSGALVVLAVPDATARRLAGAGVTSFLSVTLNR